MRKFGVQMSESHGLEIMREVNHRLPDIEIRDEQIDALNAIESNPYDRSLIVMPPGTGKTVVMAADTRWRLLQSPGSRSLFLCDSNDILNQANETFQAVVGPEFSYGLFSGDGRDYDELSVLFASFQVMRAWREAFLFDEFAYGVVDECHHGKAPTYEPTLDYFAFDHLLGATATPDRFDIKDIRDIFGYERYSLSLEEAIARKILADVDYFVITDEIVDSGIVTDDSGERYTAGSLNKTVFAPYRDETIVEIAKKYGEKIENPKTLGFCKSIEHAERYAELFGNAAALHSGLSRSKQRQLLQQFKDNEIKALFTVDKLNEGVDVPDANQVLFLRGTDSKAVYLQQLGRGLRKTKAKQKVQVLDFVNNAERLLMVDRMWREVASIAEADMPDEQEMIDIATSRVHFDERSRHALEVLRSISNDVYRPDQEVPEGSERVSQLARQLNVTRAAMMAIASSIEIEPVEFPTRRGQIPYFLPRDVEILRKTHKEIFG